jgi:hypothetical protein
MKRIGKILLAALTAAGLVLTVAALEDGFDGGEVGIITEPPPATDDIEVIDDPYTTHEPYETTEEPYVTEETYETTEEPYDTTEYFTIITEPDPTAAPTFDNTGTILTPATTPMSRWEPSTGTNTTPNPDATPYVPIVSDSYIVTADESEDSGEEDYEGGAAFGVAGTSGGVPPFALYIVGGVLLAGMGIAAPFIVRGVRLDRIYRY